MRSSTKDDRLGRGQVLLGSLILYLIAGIAPAFLNSIGAIIGARAIGGALGELGWRATFWVYALCLVLIPAVFIVVWNPEATRRLSHAPSGAAGEAVRFPWFVMIGTWIFTAFAAIVFFIVPTQTANLLTAIGLGRPAVIGLATAVGAINLAIGGASYSKLAWVRTGFALAVSFALIAAGLLLMAKARTLLLLILGIVPTGLGSGFVIPALLNWTLSRLSLRHRARGVGAWYGTFFLGQFASPLVILAAAALVGGLPTALSLFAAVCVASEIGCVFWGLVTRPMPQNAFAPF